jgi:hypothetical protein
MVKAILPLAVVSALKPSCQDGKEKKLLMPPPVAPAFAPSFHTVSLDMPPLEATRLVPPQASTCGLEAGKST